MSDSLSPASGASPPPPSGTQKIRRRNRIITSCLECRRRKLKCDRAHPCNHCQKAKRDCVFLAPSLDANSKNKLNQFKESVDYLEKGLRFQQDDQGAFAEWNVSSQSQPDAASKAKGQPREEIPADEKNLEPTPLALADIVYDDEVDDLMDDLGVRFGKVRITERIGGFVRPRFSEELVRLNPEFKPPPEITEPSGSSPNPYAGTEDQSWLDPSPEYIAPGLVFATSEDVSLLSFLPSKDFADKLLERYWYAVHPIARSVHRPSFEKQYEQFWQDVSMGYEPSTPLQALVFGALFSATVSLSDQAAQMTFRCSKADMVQTFRLGCEYALSKSNLLRTTRFSIIQAFVMYLLPLCRSEVSRAHAVLVTMAIRLAECAGLHRDGSHFSLSPIETHVRRIIYHQLMFLDYRVCFAVGPRPAIHDGEYDTQLPLNVNDRELSSLVAPSHDAARFTEMTLSCVKFEATQLQRLVWNERPRVEKGETSLTSLLRKIEEWRERTWNKYHPLLDESKPEQAFITRFLQMQVCGARIGVLHRYVVSTVQPAPERMKRLVWVSGTRVMEIAIEWESSPAFAPMFGWYMGAHNQWHVSLLFIPLLALQEKPEPETDRVWACLDYIFELPPSMSRADKIRFAFTIARARLEEAQRQRKTRLPTVLEQRLGGSSRSGSMPQADARRKSTSPIQGGIGRPSSQSHPSREPLSFGSDSTFGQTPSFGPSPSSTVENLTPRFEPYSQANFSRQSDVPMSTGQTHFKRGDSAPDSQDFSAVDWDEMERILPLDDSAMFGTSQPFDISKVEGTPEADISSWTYLPAPLWHRPPGSNQ